MKLVVAGTYGQYLAYLRENLLTSRDASYVVSPSAVRVRDNPEIVLCGNWWMREDIGQITNVILDKRARIVEGL